MVEDLLGDIFNTSLKMVDVAVIGSEDAIKEVVREMATLPNLQFVDKGRLWKPKNLGEGRKKFQVTCVVKPNNDK